ncbi:ExbD/TolR family protein [Rhodosalinus sp. 5P4]|uniref:ExbD/TolR family protein n=1 Tax=Rhodosalinus sp. 5P4 TaxID=3239196 RepID=UPI0035265F20
MFDFAAARPRRRPSLTPMIDVVFLLLVFFMLVAQFGRDAALPLATAGGGAGWSGPPRLVEIFPDRVTLNGRAVDETGLAAALAPLTETPADPLVLRPVAGADLQRLADVAETLRAAGHSQLLLVE